MVPTYVHAHSPPHFFFFKSQGLSLFCTYIQLTFFNCLFVESIICLPIHLLSLKVSKGSPSLIQTLSSSNNRDQISFNIPYSFRVCASIYGMPCINDFLILAMFISQIKHLWNLPPTLTNTFVPSALLYSSLIMLWYDQNLTYFEAPYG